MEKRLFLAVFLSLVVVFGFQTLFPSKQKSVKPSDAALESTELDKSRSLNTSVVSTKTSNTEFALPAFDVKPLHISNDIFDLAVSNKGGDIQAVYLKKYDYSFPLYSVASFELNNSNDFKLQETHDAIVAINSSADWQVTKKVSLNSDYTFNVNYSIKNNSNQIKNINYKINNFITDLSRVDKSTVQSDASLFEYSIKTEKNILRRDNAVKVDDKWNKEENINIEWIAFRDRYFATIIESSKTSKNYYIKNMGGDHLSVGSMVSATINPGESISLDYKVYAGPQKLDIMEKAGKSFTTLMVFSNWGWLDAISKLMYWLLGFLYNLLHSWGLCIIAISLIVYGLMYPLTAKGLVSMKKLQALQPQMKEIQEKYKNNPERLNKEVVQLYKVNQVNPLGGCLPMVLQMPIFVGLYQVLWRSVYFRGESFLWMKDLSLPDRTLKLPFSLPFLGEYLNILPILMIGIMMVQQKLTMQSMAATTPEQASQQKIMAIVFPFLIGFIFYNMASGLNLYFVIFYLLSTLTQWKITTSTK